MSLSANENLLGRGTISLLVVAGLLFSLSTFLVLDETTQTIFSEQEVKSSSIPICENGLCYTNNEKGDLEHILVQQEDVSSIRQLSQIEDFSNLKLVKNLPKMEIIQTGNKVSLFAEKDSFIREGVQNGNEGSNHVLKIMGTGPTNNRALVSFNQADISDVSEGRTLVSATMKLYIQDNNQNWGDGQLINIHSLDTNWQEGNGLNHNAGGLFISGGVTWSCSVNSNCSDEWNGGSFNHVPTDSVWITNQVDDYWIKLDVTKDILNNKLSDESPGWIIMKSNEDSEGQINISSRESQSHIPELVLVFSDE